MIKQKVRHVYYLSGLVKYPLPDTLIPLTGAELLVEQVLFPAQDGQKPNPNIMVVGSTLQRLLNGAEDVGLFKEFQDGTMRGFTYANRESFKDFEGEIQLWCVFWQNFHNIFGFILFCEMH